MLLRNVRGDTALDVMTRRGSSPELLSFMNEFNNSPYQSRTKLLRTDIFIELLNDIGVKHMVIYILFAFIVSLIFAYSIANMYSSELQTLEGGAYWNRKSEL